MKHIWKKPRKVASLACVKKEKIAVKLQKVIKKKSQELLTEHLHKRQPIQNIQ